jgi:hypothetical protein
MSVDGKYPSLIPARGSSQWDAAEQKLNRPKSLVGSSTVVRTLTLSACKLNWLENPQNPRNPQLNPARSKMMIPTQNTQRMRRTTMNMSPREADLPTPGYFIRLNCGQPEGR